MTFALVIGLPYYVVKIQQDKPKTAHIAALIEHHSISVTS